MSIWIFFMLSFHPQIELKKENWVHSYPISTKTTKAFLESCSNITKVHDAFYNQFRNVPVGPYDHEQELAMSLAWKFYLVMTDFMVKQWYPESNIYGER